MTERETSESGAPIYRHEAKDRKWTAPKIPALHLEDIEAHLEDHLGEIKTVYHEILSDLIHLDVLFLPADGKRSYHTLVTSGVSDLPMTVPDGMEDFRHAELMINLPAEWPLDDESFKDEDNYWPIRLLKDIGRLPHDYDTWIGWGHTIPNGDPAEPIANTQYTGALLLPPYWLGPEFFVLQLDSGDKLRFYNVVPLYQEEMGLKLSKGLEALEALFDKKGISPVVDIGRFNVAKKRRWFGWR